MILNFAPPYLVYEVNKIPFTGNDVMHDPLLAAAFIVGLLIWMLFTSSSSGGEGLP